MRTVILILICLPMISIAQKRGTRKYLDAKRGFKEIILGQSIRSLDGKIKEYDGEGLPGATIYQISDESLLSVGEDIDIAGLFVASFKDSILFINIITDLTNATPLFNTLVEAYGLPRQDNEFIEEYVWRGREVSLIADLSGYETASFSFYDLAFYDKYLAMKEEKATDAVDDL